MGQLAERIDVTDRGRSDHRRRILVVEDDPDLRAALIDDLADSGAEVFEASDGLDALERMRESNPDVVVIDLLMPRMDGWQFRIEQRHDPALARTPIIVMSASGTSAAKAVDADAYLAKPFGAGILERAIDDVLAARAHRDQIERAAHRERLAALGTLAAGLAHEINNPLTYVLMNLAAADQVLPTIGGDPARTEHVRRLLAQTIEGAERISGVVRSVRILAREEHGAAGPLDVRAPLDAALTIISHELRAKAELITDFGEMPFVIADEGQLGQVFLNLLTNALQAIPDSAPHATITLTTSTDDQGRAVVEIRDTGAGIPEHLIDRVFEPFFTTKPVGEGTGLGLSITQGIVAALGGEISVSSQLGRGTTFRVALPGGRRRARTETEA
jgi:signal transduction histidine kinase